jgi:hypothetical protein
MSLNVPSVQVAKVLDPRLRINSRRDYVALKGSLVNTHQQFPATNVNNSSIQITCNPPNRGIVISRLVYKRVVFDVTITGTNTGPSNLLVDGYHAPRFMPLTQCTTSESITINNDTLTQAPLRQYWPELMRYHNEFDNRFGQLSLCPSMQDQNQTYEQGAQGVRNPLALYNDNSYENTRGGFVGYEVLSNGPTSATLRITTTEPILISPLVAGKMSNFTGGLSGIQNMSYTATLGDLRRVMSLVADQGAPGVIDIQSSGISVNLSSASLLFNYLTPDPLNPVPRNSVNSYFSIVSYPTRTSALIAPGNEVSITMQSVQVTSIPRRIYVFARRDDSEQTAFTADSGLGLPQTGNPLTVTWNNNQFCSQMTTQDIYNTSVKNSCNLSYSQFTRDVSSVICLDLGIDIGLMSDEAPGTLGNYQLGLTCRFKNNHPTESIAPTLYVVVVYEGTFNVNDGNCSHMIGVLSREDVLNSQQVPGITYQKAQDVFGGSFFSKLRDAFRSAHDYAKRHKLVSKGLKLIPDPRAQVASRVAASMGYGMSGGSLTNSDIKNRISYASELAEDDDYDEY